MLQKNVLEYLENTARRFPDKLAFSDEGRSFSFAQLLAAAKGLGSALAAQTDRPNRPVVVLVDHRAANLAAFQGVLSAGDYYVPLDSQMPLPRLRGIVETLAPAALVYGQARERVAQALADLCPVLLLDEAAFTHSVDEARLQCRRDRVLDIDPVYAIFTSGSTGTPKGIILSHRSVIDFIEWMADACGFTERDILANQAPFYFDLSVKDIYITLKCGASTHIIPKKDFLFPPLLMDFLADKAVTALVWATSAFHLVANSGVLEQKAPQTLRTVIVGGETLRAKQLNRWKRALPQVQYINLYGPTEVTVDCTWYPIRRDFADDERIPIGTACANKEVFLLDESLQPVPPGQPGALCVRGIGLAKGYFAQWDKTRSAFMQDPRNPNYPDLIYRTGDLALEDEHGVFTFLSRRDGQIKHMGYRIELGEIETVLSAFPALEEVVCFFDPEKDRIHCAYTGGEDPKALAKAARAALPRYMVPNLYHPLETMPHNPNGKIDRPRLQDAIFRKKVLIP